MLIIKNDIKMQENNKKILNIRFKNILVEIVK